MREFFDVSGASGSIYRFRAFTSLAEPPQTAGNFILVDADPNSPRVVCCGTVKSLAMLTEAGLTTVENAPRAQTFVRLNVARATRLEEYADIAHQHAPPHLSPESD